MTEMAGGTPAAGYGTFLDELRKAVLVELSTSGLDNPERLAAALAVAPMKTRALLRRRSWSFDDAAWIVGRLGLPVTLTVQRNGTSGSEGHSEGEISTCSGTQV